MPGRRMRKIVTRRYGPVRSWENIPTPWAVRAWRRSERRRERGMPKWINGRIRRQR
jgi:hypothetical protein